MRVRLEFVASVPLANSKRVSLRLPFGVSPIMPRVSDTGISGTVTVAVIENTSPTASCVVSGIGGIVSCEQETAPIAANVYMKLLNIFIVKRAVS